MHGFSTVDGFVEITECLAEMIKYNANEPSAGLFYIQQHTLNAVPNIVNLRNNVVEKSRETTLHTEDLEDSIMMVNSMKECGFPTADEMIREIKKSLVILSTEQPKRGLIHNWSSGFQIGRTSSWGPATWGLSAVCAQRDGEATDSYFSNVFKTAKQRASNFKWPQLDSKDSIQTKGEKLLSYPDLPLSVAAAGLSPTLPDTEADELPLSIQVADELQENVQADVILPSHESYDEFKASKEAKLEECLERTSNLDDIAREQVMRKGCSLTT